MIYIYFTVCQSKFNILEWKKYIEKKDYDHGKFL